MIGWLTLSVLPVAGVCLVLIGAAEIIIALFYHPNDDSETDDSSGQNLSKEIFQVNRDRLYDLSIPMAVVNENGTALILNDAFTELM